MKKITHKGMNPYLYSIAFVWLFIFENEGFESEHYLIIKFGIFVAILFMSTMFGDKETIEVQEDKIVLSQKRVSLTIDLCEIESLELVEFDRELIIKTKGTKYSYKTYSLGKKKIIKFFESNDLLLKNMM